MRRKAAKLWVPIALSGLVLSSAPSSAASASHGGVRTLAASTESLQAYCHRAEYIGKRLPGRNLPAGAGDAVDCPPAR